ncbi:hypothetical protein ABT289_17185 [Streptomyces fimicarius]|uniref:hypothetical protein n=1 Tax=Streptomyces griseus TaxID=1911 RepID=UPI00331EB6D7
MNTFRRHSAKGWLTAVALGALVLTGCGQEPSHRLEPAAAAEAAPSPTAGGATDDGRPHDGKKSADPAESGKKAAPSASSGRDDRKGPRTDTDRKSDVSAPSSAPEGRTATPAAPEATSEPAVGAPFAGTEQFVTISKAWSDDGRTYLSVRPARKKVNTRFDTWEVTPGTGPFTTVSMADSSRVLLAVPVREEVTGTSRAELLAYSPDRLVTLISRLDPALSGGIGYDLAFDGNGRVTGLTSLYRP